MGESRIGGRPARWYATRGLVTALGTVAVMSGLHCFSEARRDNPRLGALWKSSRSFPSDTRSLLGQGPAGSNTMSNGQDNRSDSTDNLLNRNTVGGSTPTDQRDAFLACERTYGVGRASVLLRQERNLDSDAHPELPTCRASLESRVGATRIQLLEFDDIEPVGGPYGLFVPPEQPVRGHLLVLKIGDYDGRLIIVDPGGAFRNVNGGAYVVVHDCRLLLSRYDADLPGFTMIDTDTGAVLAENEDLWVADWYRFGGEIVVVSSGVSWVPTDEAQVIKVQSFSCETRRLRERAADSASIREANSLGFSFIPFDHPWCSCS